MRTNLTASQGPYSRVVLSLAVQPRQPVLIVHTEHRCVRWPVVFVVLHDLTKDDREALRLTAVEKDRGGEGDIVFSRAGSSASIVMRCDPTSPILVLERKAWMRFLGAAVDGFLPSE